MVGFDKEKQANKQNWNYPSNQKSSKKVKKKGRNGRYYPSNLDELSVTGRSEVRIGDPRKEEQNPSLSPPKARVPDEECRDEKREEEETDEEDRVANG